MSKWWMAWLATATMKWSLDSHPSKYEPRSYVFWQEPVAQRQIGRPIIFNSNCYWKKLWELKLSVKWFLDLNETKKSTFNFPPLSSSLSFSRLSTKRLTSLWRRRPKSRNIVDPPDNTMFYKETFSQGKKLDKLTGNMHFNLFQTIIYLHHQSDT